MTPRSGARPDRGQATLELVALIPLVVLAMFLVVDVIGVVWAANAASEAAFDGARARSLDQSYTAAVANSLPSSVEHWSAAAIEENGVKVTVQAPGSGLLGHPSITREVVLP